MQTGHMGWYLASGLTSGTKIAGDFTNVVMQTVFTNRSTWIFSLASKPPSTFSTFSSIFSVWLVTREPFFSFDTAKSAEVEHQEPLGASALKSSGFSPLQTGGAGRPCIANGHIECGHFSTDQGQ